MEQWEKHGILTYWMKKVFVYLDRYYLPDHKLPSLSQTGLLIFKQHVFEKINVDIVRTIFELIEAEREGEVVDWIKLKKILYCYRMMGLTNATIEKVEKSNELVWQGTANLQYYKEMFEKEFIRQTTDFYKKQADQWIQNCSCPEYVSAALASLKKEEDKVLNFLDKETRPKLLESLEIVLIDEKAQALTEKERTGVADMLKEKRQDELKKLYSLLARKQNTLQYIYDKMKPYIEGRGRAVVGDKEVLRDPFLFINKLLELKKEMDDMVREAFSNHPSFMQTRDRAFQSFMNDCAYTPSFLGEYVDMLMKQGLKGKEADMEQYIDDVFDLFKLLKQKDAFTARHQQLYALRLLQNTSISQDAEEMLISRLKIELGAQYVSKLVQMGVDMKNSRDMTENFRKKDHKGIVKGIEMTVKVLTTGLWGEQKNSGCKLPPEIKSCIDSFEVFYKQNHTGKNLAWIAGQGDCEIKTTFAPKPYTLIVTVYQTAILCLFNSQPTYTFTEIKAQTGLPEEDLAAHLFPLMNPKLGKLLIKENLKTPKCLPNEKITLNTGFGSSSLRLTLIPVVHQAKVSTNILWGIEISARAQQRHRQGCKGTEQAAYHCNPGTVGKDNEGSEEGEAQRAYQRSYQTNQLLQAGASNDKAAD
eukprot:TRINITY_DN3553_c0_g1_i1.p2 TRINITY_DN3553_c0_g1~~TRINITY_DN3553_c0_g1_i1.p2  ORF type:complete len:644 (-),score=82.86 TRINITY_DN3553_c0_g1_i1:7834-9765(-)